MKINFSNLSTKSLQKFHRFCPFLPQILIKFFPDYPIFIPNFTPITGFSPLISTLFQVQPMIGSAKGYAQVQNDQTGNHLITSGRELLGAVGLVRQAIEPVVEPEFPPPPEVPEPFDGPPDLPNEPEEDGPPEIPEPPEEDFPSSDEGDRDDDIYLPAKELFEEVNKWMTKGT